MMRATNFPFSHTGFVGTLVKLTYGALFGPSEPAPHADLPSHRPEEKPAPRAESPSLLDRIDSWFWRQQQREREAYLAQATDVFDLEERMRRLDRGGA